jgi:PAS domain S-box-containing protein
LEASGAPSVATSDDPQERVIGGLRAAFEALPDAKLITNTSGIIVHANALIEPVFGYAPRELTGIPLDRVLPGLSAELGVAAQATALRRNSTQGRTGRHKSGRAVPLEVSFGVLHANGARLALISIADITERKRAEENERRQSDELARLNDDLRRSNGELASLSARLLTIQDEERERIAYDLHDDFGQLLAVMRMNLGALYDENPELSTEVREQVRRTLDQLCLATASMRSIVKKLRALPLDTLGLVPTLEQQIVEFREQSGVECELRIEPGDLTLDMAVGTTVLRIVQEALTNILRHARATRASVTITRELTQLTLRVSDDGAGLPRTASVASGNSLGLFSIRERARTFGGSMIIGNREEGGTELLVRLFCGTPGVPQ